MDTIRDMEYLNQALGREQSRVESLGMNLSKILRQTFQGRRVLITGHTGFKGSWLGLWLTKLGAKVIGYSLPPPTEPSLFEICALQEQTVFPSPATSGTSKP